ncbi:MAG: pentapeptide repeat-containing protein [Aphanocapsa sp. GSE-SYN-MK-11-07L]|jgi:uncharacterized protein YjbI with pentapeptide repeats|nr:pentapeptide repeat-containing protein [Aphanocapsa sp. GSE-SYN-MK-11-07L]
MSGHHYGQSSLDVPVSGCSSQTELNAAELLQRYARGEREFMSIDLVGADLRGVNLRGAELSYADLSEANLAAADLRGADLSFANLTDANLDQANLSGAILMGANLKGTNLQTARLGKADYDDSTRFPDGFNPAQSEMGQPNQGHPGL